MNSTPFQKILKLIFWLTTQCLSLSIILMIFGLYLGTQIVYALDHGTLKMKSKLLSITTFGTWTSFHTLDFPAGTKPHGRCQMVDIFLLFFSLMKKQIETYITVKPVGPAGRMLGPDTDEVTATCTPNMIGGSLPGWVLEPPVDLINVRCSRCVCVCIYT